MSECTPLLEEGPEEIEENSLLTFYLISAKLRGHSDCSEGYCYRNPVGWLLKPTFWGMYLSQGEHWENRAWGLVMNNWGYSRLWFGWLSAKGPSEGLACLQGGACSHQLNWGLVREAESLQDRPAAGAWLDRPIWQGAGGRNMLSTQLRDEDETTMVRLWWQRASYWVAVLSPAYICLILK